MRQLGTQRAYHGIAGLALVGLMTGSTGGLGPVLGALGLGGDSSATPQASSQTTSGRLHMRSQPLRRGCQRYTYGYRLQIPEGEDFDFEIFVTDPRGVSQASDVILSGADPLRGRKHMTICRSNTEPGRFILHGTLYTNDGQGPTQTTRVPDEPFRLTAAPHRKRHH